jgi:putative ABC transport system permease protein
MNKPSALALRFLCWFCPEHLYEEIEGDLLQKFNRDVKKVGERTATRRLIWNAVRFFRPGIILRNKFSINENQLPMFKNYFITSLRHIRKSKVNFAFKLGGLSLAIFSFLAIALYVAFQFSFDTFHDDYQNIYRVNSQRKENGVIEKYAIAPCALGPVLQQHIPEVTSIVRIRYANHTYLRLDKELISCGLLEADSSLFNVLTFRFIKGDRTALQHPNSIVLTRTMANRLFGTTDVLQRTLNINKNPNLYQVTAVIEDTEPNSQVFLDAVMPISDQSELSSISIVDPVTFVDQVTRPEKSLHFLVRSPDSNLHFLVSPEIALHLITG